MKHVLFKLYLNCSPHWHSVLWVCNYGRNFLHSNRIQKNIMTRSCDQTIISNLIHTLLTHIFPSPSMIAFDDKIFIDLLPLDMSTSDVIKRINRLTLWISDPVQNRVLFQFLFPHTRQVISELFNLHVVPMNLWWTDDKAECVPCTCGQCNPI